MADKTQQKLELIVTAKDDGASATVEGISKGIQQQIGEAQTASQVGKIRAQQYKDIFRQETSRLQKEEAVAKTSASQALREARQESLGKLKEQRLAGIDKEAGGFVNLDAEYKAQFRTNSIAASGRIKPTEKTEDPLGLLKLESQVYAAAKIGETFEKIAGAAVAIADKLHDSRESTANIVGDFARGLPLLGGWVKGADSVSEFFTGAGREARHIQEENEARGDSGDLHRRFEREAGEKKLAVDQSLRAIWSQAIAVGTRGAVTANLGQDAAHDQFAAGKRLESRQANLALAQDPETRKKLLAEQAIIDRPIPEATFNRAKHPFISPQKYFEDRERLIAEQQAATARQKQLFGDQAGAASANTEAAEREIAADNDRKEKQKAENIAQQARDWKIQNRQRKDAIAEQSGAIKQEQAKLAGGGSDAEAQEIKRRRDARIAEIRAAADEERDEKIRAGATSREGLEVGLEGIADRTQAQVKTEQDKAELQLGEVKHRQGLARLDIEQRIRNESMEGIQIELAGNNHLHESELARLQIADKYAQRRREIIELMRTADTPNREALKTELGGLEAREKESNVARLSKDAEENKLTLLREQANAGSRAAKIRLDQLEIERRFRIDREQLKGQLADPNASPAQKLALQQQLDSLTMTEDIAKKRSLGQLGMSAQLAGMQSGAGGLTGLASHARETAFLAQGKALADLNAKEKADQAATAANTAAMKTELAKAVAFLGQLVGIKLPSVFGGRA